MNGKESGSVRVTVALKKPLQEITDRTNFKALEVLCTIILKSSKDLTNNSLAGEWEHIVVSNIKRFIPDSVKQTWREWRASMKKAEAQIEGSNEVSEHVEMAGWGVEEADKANKSDASTCPPKPIRTFLHHFN